MPTLCRPKDAVSTVDELAPGVRNRRMVQLSDLRIWTGREEEKRLVRFMANDVQTHIVNELAVQYDVDPSKIWEMKGVRKTYLKARQQGISSIWLAIFYLAWCNLPRMIGAVITNSEESQLLLWERVRNYHNNLSPDLRPPTKFDNEGALVRLDNGSILMIGTAGQADLGRSDAWDHALVSETGFWPAKAKRQFTALFSSLPRSGVFVEESTAGGINDHRTRFMLAWKKKQGIFKASFFPWFLTKEYASPNPKPETWSEEVLADQIEFQLTDNQAQWLHEKREEMEYAGDLEKIDQEYPPTVERAFLAGGKGSYYPADYLLALLDELESIELEQPDFLIQEYRKNDSLGMSATLRIFHKPVKGELYALGADGASGFDDSDATDLDWNHNAVFRLRDGLQCSDYWSRESAEYHATTIEWLATWYNDAIVIVENHSEGTPLIERLRDQKVTLFRMRDGKDEKQQSNKIGYYATEKSKQDRDEALKGELARAAYIWRRKRCSPLAAAREANSAILLEKRTVGELINYHNLANGKRGAVTGHDDSNTSVSQVVWYRNRFGYVGQAPPPEEEKDEMTLVVKSGKGDYEDQRQKRSQSGNFYGGSKKR